MTREAAIAAVKADPQQAEGWYQLGRLLALEGERDKARDCFARAVALDPTVPAARRPAPAPLPTWL